MFGQTDLYDALSAQIAAFTSGPDTWSKACSIFQDVFSSFVSLDPHRMLTSATSSPLGTITWLTGLLILFAFVAAELSGNYSQVDRLWSVFPLVGAAIIAWDSAANPRVLAMSACVAVWGVRLTYNFYHRRGYDQVLRGRIWAGEEDHRWAVARTLPVLNTRVGWFALNLVFISIIQMAVLAGLTFPIVACTYSVAPITGADSVVCLVWLLLFVGESVTDNQQRAFQREKYRRIAAKESLQGDYSRGFRTTGAFSASRHLNFFCEQGMWVVMAAWGYVGSGSLQLWYVVPCLALVSIFQGSTWITEKISCSKYPLYKEYQKRVPRFFPNPVALLMWVSGCERPVFP